MVGAVSVCNTLHTQQAHTVRRDAVGVVGADMVGGVVGVGGACSAAAVARRAVRVVSACVGAVVHSVWLTDICATCITFTRRAVGISGAMFANSTDFTTIYCTIAMVCAVCVVKAFDTRHPNTMRRITIVIIGTDSTKCMRITLV